MTLSKNGIQRVAVTGALGNLGWKLLNHLAQTGRLEKAITTNGTDWDDGFALVNGMSNNTGMKWSLAWSRSLLGYEPEDDVFAAD